MSQILISVHNYVTRFYFYLFFSCRFFNILVYHFKYNIDVYVSRSCFIIFYFRGGDIHQILPTLNAIFLFSRNSMLAYHFMLHGISDIQCYLQWQPTFDVSFFRFSYSQHSMLAETNVANIYVRTYRYLFPQINIHRWSKNIQHYMLAHAVLHDISIETLKWVILPTFILSHAVYITLPFNWVKV